MWNVCRPPHYLLVSIESTLELTDLTLIWHRKQITWLLPTIWNVGWKLILTTTINNHRKVLVATTLAECLVTFGTSIWLFSNVGPFMGLHVIIAVKFLVTFWTGIRFLNCVGPLVCLQMWALAKPLFTFSANKWFLSCVGPFTNL